jgi:uncharacterized protein (TIGR03067 family)
MVRTLLAGALFASATFAAPVPKDFVKPKPKLDGQWTVTAYESNGRALKTSSILNQTWTFSGDSLSITRATAPKGAAPTKVRVRVDPKSTEFDYILSTASTRLGLYAIEGDTLTVCMTINTTTGVRPTNLDGGTGILKYVFKRVGKDN